MDKLCWMKVKKEKQINTQHMGRQGDALIFINRFVGGQWQDINKKG